MLDGHFFFGGKRIAIGAEPDLLWSIGSWLTEMGCTLSAAVTTTQSPMLERMQVETVLIGDLEDLERDAGDCDLLITHSHGRQAAERLHIPLFRMGMPTFDRLGAGHLLSVGYRGTRDLMFAIGNLFMAEPHEPIPTRGVRRGSTTRGVKRHGASTRHVANSMASSDGLADTQMRLISTPSEGQRGSKLEVA